MMTGDAYKLPIALQVGDAVAEPLMFKELEVFVGNIRKTMSSGEVVFDYEKKVFLVPLTQQETFRQRENIEVQIRCKFKDGSVIGIKAGELNLAKAVSKVVL